MNNSGFSLLEILIYITCSAFLGLLICQLVVFFYSKSDYLLHATDGDIRLLMAVDKLDMEIRSADINAIYLNSANNCLIFKFEGQDVGYSVEKGNLIKAWGEFDYTGLKWNKRSKNIILQKVDNIAFKIIKNNENILAIDYQIILGCSVKNNKNKLDKWSLNRFIKIFSN